MPSVIQPETAPPSVSDTIARSMSRYRGTRQTKPAASLASPQMPHLDQMQKLKISSQREQHLAYMSSKEEPLEIEMKDIRSRRGPSTTRTPVVDGTANGATTRSAAAYSKLSNVRPGPEQAFDTGNLQREHTSTAAVPCSRASEDMAKYEARVPQNRPQPHKKLQRQHQSGDKEMRLNIAGNFSRKGRESSESYSQRHNDWRQGSLGMDQPAMKPERLDYDAVINRQEVQMKPAILRPSVLPRKSFTQRITGTTSKHQASNPDSRAELKRTISFPIAIDPGNIAHAPAPDFDAPISAVNAGERRVMVKYQESLVPIAITPSTTPVDVVRSAADRIRELVSCNSAVLLESFKQLGLERPLRKYEHVRDVLNSWDNDAQNTLVIVPSPTGGNDNDLNFSNVPRERPEDTSVYLYHSQMPGQWDKRWITLRSDGQVLIAKTLGGEASNICHVSDFDIYVPTSRQMAKRIKPPKKVCFAVKSQQKSSMFMSTANFVHFFSTSDRKLATSWYKAIQEWRSWYLVNVMGEGQGRSITATKTPKMDKAKQGLSNAISHNRRRHSNPPVGALPHHTNSAMAHHAAKNAQHISSPRQDVPPAWTPMVKSTPETRNVNPDEEQVRDRARPPVSFPKKLTRDARRGEPTHKHSIVFVQGQPEKASEPEPFAAAGLLGRAYSQRQKAQHDHSPRTSQQFTTALTTVNAEAVGLQRASSQRSKPKPLIDLTPQYQEPPQHSKKGRGVMVKQIPVGGLVDIATSPEVAVPIPPATAWRRPGNNNGDMPAPQRTSTMRSGRPVHLRGHRSIDTGSNSSAPVEEDDAFMGGLLAKTGASQGDSGHGRGIKTGNRQAREPMLDVSEPSQYLPGSLLARTEKQMGSMA